MTLPISSTPAALNAQEVLTPAATTLATKSLFSISATWHMVVSKVQTIWNAFLPYIEMGAKALSTRLGIAGLCFAASIPCFRLTRSEEISLASISTLACGVLAVGAGTYMLLTSGYMPSFLQVNPV